MKILTLMSRLLDYPTNELFAARHLMLDLIVDSRLDLPHQKALMDFVNRRLEGELLDWQEEYDGLFERGRSLSLLVYEHIHGESRDRGQAMVELLAQYRAAGLEIAAHELPDHLPLLLEFIATQGDEAVGWLSDIAPVLALLAARLDKRGSDYAALFKALLALSNSAVDLDDIQRQIADEKPDHTAKALDKVWEEEAVTFGGDAINGGCPSSVNRPSEGQRKDQFVPVNWMEAETVIPDAERGVKS